MGVYIYLKVAKVGAQNADMTTSIERTEISLEQGKNFNSFISLLHVQTFLFSEAEKPRIIKAVKTENGKEVGEVDIKPFQDALDEKLESMKKPVGEVDYKALAEKQANANKEMQAQNAAMMDRLAALEAKLSANTEEDTEEDTEENPLHVKANKLGIKFRADIADDKLLARIKEVEPGF